MSSGAGPVGLDIDEVLNILSSADDTDLAKLVELVATICEVEAAGITIRRGHEFHVLVTHGIDPFVCSERETFCRFTMETDEVFCIEDATQDPRFAGIAWADGQVGRTRFYASAPVYAPDRRMVGRLCVIDPEPKRLSAVQRRSLETLALSVTKLIELRLLHAQRTAQRTLPSPSEGRAAVATVKSQLAAELSHDMRVPLTSIVASVELLEDELEHHPDRAVSTLLDRTTRAADRMVRMLDQNLQRSTSSSRSVPQAVDVGRVVRQLRLDSAALLEATGTTLEAADLPVVLADPDDLYSVLQNLVTNSIKFARPGVPVVVRISGRHRPGRWRISVSDNGVGIPEDRRADVFSLFSRVDDAIEGHGIGLATVARIVAGHGGRTGAGASAAGGAEIWFELPDLQ